MSKKRSNRRARRGKASRRRVHEPSGLPSRGFEDSGDLPDHTDEVIHGPHLVLKVMSAAMAASEKIHKADDFEEVYERHLDAGDGCPYMSARAGVASVLARLGRLDEAIEHFREMIELNPFDHQGARYLYLATLLDAGRNADAERLLANDMFTYDNTAPVAYARALLA